MCTGFRCGTLCRSMSGRMRANAGQTAAEYMGVLLVVSVIIAAVATTSVGTQIAKEMERIVCEIVGGDCGEPDVPVKLSDCVTAEATDKISINGQFDVRFLTVKLEGGVEYMRQKRANGEVAMTFKLSQSGGVAERIKKLVDVTVKGGPASSVTFLLPNDAAANTFAQQIKDSAKAIALSPLNRFGISGGEPHIDFPPIETVAYEQSGAISVGVDVDSTGGYANGSLELGAAIGFKRDMTEGRDSSGEITAYYKINGKAQGAAGMPLIGPGFTGALNGELTMSVTWDKHGNAKKLSLQGVGGYEGGVEGKAHPTDLKAALKYIDQIDLTANSRSGKKLEFQVDLELDDATERQLPGSIPDGGSPGRPGPRGSPALEPHGAEGQDPDAPLRHRRRYPERGPRRHRRRRRHRARHHQRRAHERRGLQVRAGLRAVGGVPMRRAVAIAIAGTLIAAGCGGGDGESAAVPEGFKAYDGETFTFAYPAAWPTIEAGQAKGAQGPKGTGGLAPQAVAAGAPSPAVSFDTILEGFKADNLTRRGNWKIVRQEDVEIEGAKEARLTEALYDEVTGSTTTPVRTIDVHARTEDGTLYDFFVRAPDADFDGDRLREVVDTFQIK